MSRLNRRAFFGSSLAGLSALAAGHTPLVSGPGPNPDAPDPTALNGLFLTWQRDPTTTMTVQWVGIAGPGDSVVGCASHPLAFAWHTAPVTSKPFPGTELKVFRAEFTGLAPGTEYQMRVGNRPTVYRFRTMPARATNTFTFVTGGDAGVNPAAVASNILAAKQSPNFVLLAGDLAYDNGLSPKTFLEFLRNYSGQLIDPEGRLVPLLACLGNHEVCGGYSRKREDAGSFLSLFDGFYRDTTYGVLDFGDYLSLVLLDSGHLSAVEGEQTDWLTGALRAREGRRHLFVANHVPAYPSVRDPKNTGDGLRKHWCPLFERHCVDAVLEHHDHVFKRTHPLIGGLRDANGVVYMGDGSWGQLRTPAPIESRPFLTAVSKAYHLTVHRLEGDRRFHVALEHSGRVADVWASQGKRPARRG